MNGLASQQASLEATAARLRGSIIATSSQAEVPHLGSCLSCVDILTALYFSVLNASPEKADQGDRDRFILSKGHAAPALFQTLALRGYFPAHLMAELARYGEDGSRFGEHPPAHGVPGIEAATGALGHGLPMGVGLALASRLMGHQNRVYVLMGDGECNEGSVWEAAMMASAQRLERLCVIIDYNKWQATGRSEEVLDLSPLSVKWQAFGWNSIEVDGHDMDALVQALRQPPSGSARPSAIIAHTVKGKGVSFMEDDNNWHYRIPKQAEVARAHLELGLCP